MFGLTWLLLMIICPAKILFQQMFLIWIFLYCLFMLKRMSTLNGSCTKWFFLIKLKKYINLYTSIFIYKSIDITVWQCRVNGCGCWISCEGRIDAVKNSCCCLYFSFNLFIVSNVHYSLVLFFISLLILLLAVTSNRLFQSKLTTKIELSFRFPCQVPLHINSVQHFCCCCYFCLVVFCWLLFFLVEAAIYEMKITFILYT